MVTCQHSIGSFTTYFERMLSLGQPAVAAVDPIDTSVGWVKLVFEAIAIRLVPLTFQQDALEGLVFFVCRHRTQLCKVVLLLCRDHR